jgi:hypothetical protein
MSGYVQRYGWLATVAATVIVYVWQPLWPRVTAPIPLWPRILPFVLFVCLVALKSSSRLSSALRGAMAVGAYIYLEHVVVYLTFAFEHGQLGRHALTDYFIVAILGALMNLSAPLTFAAVESLRAVLGWRTLRVEGASRD